MDRKHRITPQWVAPMAWTGDYPNNQRPSRDAHSYVEKQESDYLQEFYLLANMEGKILELANVMHHYTHREVPDENEDLFTEDMRYNRQKKERVLSLLESIVDFHTRLTNDLYPEEEEGEEGEGEEECEEEETQTLLDVTVTAAKDSQDPKMIVLDVISQILDFMDQDGEDMKTECV